MQRLQYTKNACSLRVQHGPSCSTAMFPIRRNKHNFRASWVKCEAAEEQPAAQQQPSSQVERVPLNELPKPHSRAMKTLHKSATKTGVNKLLVDTLNSVSFTIVGEDTAFNWAVAQGLASRIGWFPCQTQKILLGLLKSDSVEDMLLEHGHATLVQEEQKVLAGLQNQARVVVSTMAGMAAAQQGTYPDLYGSLIIWVDEEDKSQPKPLTAERRVYGNAEIQLKIKKQRGFAAMCLTPEQHAKEAVDVLVQKLIQFLNQDSNIVAKKKEYVRLGCRGDWPDLKPAEWNPLLEGLNRKPLAAA